MPVLDRSPKALPTEVYVVIEEVQNLHIAGRKVRKGDEITLSAPLADHWLNEGVIKLKSDVEAAAKQAAKSTEKTADKGAASATTDKAAS